jgi:hypothetical protein
MRRLLGTIRRLEVAAPPQWFAVKLKWLDPFPAEPFL